MKEEQQLATDLVRLLAGKTDVVDEFGNPLTLATAGSSGAPGVVRLEDGTSTNLATVAAFHNADDQALAGTAYGMLTGGVAQLLNAIGNLDRQRETGQDNIPHVGVATGTQQLVSPFTVTGQTSIAVNQGTLASPIAVTVSALSGTNRGAPWALKVGSVVTIDSTGTNPEPAVVVAVNASTPSISLVFSGTGAKFVHTASYTIASGTLNQARDATIADGVIGLGLAAGATYLLNAALNSGAGGWEGERSAAGELDGASGTGTAVAAEYEHNSGGPSLASGLASGLQFDRARNLQGKGLLASTITSTTAGQTNVVFASLAATDLIQPGAPLILSGGSGFEVVYVSQTWTPGSSATVPLQNPVQANGRTTVWSDVYAPVGPQLNGFTPIGIGIEEEALFDPVTNQFFLARGATQDAMASQNIPAESEALWNSTGFDRARSNLAVTLFPSAAQSATQTSADQLNVNGHALDVILDVTAIGTATLTLTINAKDPASGKYYNLLTGAVVTTLSTNIYKVGPALTAAANLVANAWVPRIFQIVVTQGGVGNATYSVGYNLGE